MIDYGFNTADVELDTPGLPVGTHKVMITAEEIKETPEKPTNPKRLVVTFEAVDGDAKGKTLLSNYNLWNANPQVVNIAKQELKRIEVATGKPVSAETPLLNRVLRIEVRKQKGNDQYTEIAKYLPEEEEIPF